MIKANEDALICDLAETYHILDYKSLPPITVAILAVGLRDDSRIKMHMGGTVMSADRLMLAGVLDRLSMLLWMQSKYAQKGKNRPKLILDSLKAVDVNSFATGKDFDSARELIIKKWRQVHGD